MFSLVSIKFTSFTIFSLKFSQPSVVVFKANSVKGAWKFKQLIMDGGKTVFKTVSDNEKIYKVLCTFHRWSKENVSLELNWTVLKKNYEVFRKITGRSFQTVCDLAG